MEQNNGYFPLSEEDMNVLAMRRNTLWLSGAALLLPLFLLAVWVASNEFAIGMMMVAVVAGCGLLVQLLGQRFQADLKRGQKIVIREALAQKYYKHRHNANHIKHTGIAFVKLASGKEVALLPAQWESLQEGDICEIHLAPRSKAVLWVGKEQATA